jgi:predicted nucleotidyltransferase component of viral defense system
MKAVMRLFEYDRRTLGKLAQDYGFVRDTLEKVCRLVEILSFFERDPLLSEDLALKGGTAINLTILDVPRLSIDIDLDFARNITRDEMLGEREIVTESIIKYMSTSGYECDARSKLHHALDSLVFTYMNTAGNRDNVKIEINYSLRCHVLPLEHRVVNTLQIFRKVTAFSLAPEEIYGSKIVALLSRAAARDLYDIANLLDHNLFDTRQEANMRKCALFYYAVSTDKIPEMMDLSSIDAITQYMIRTNLIPVIRKSDKFDLVDSQAKTKVYLSRIFTLNETEQKFMEAFKNKEYLPELLFDDSEMLERVRNHPMAIWKTRRI